MENKAGMYYYGARYYNPQTSIWLSVDPMSDQRPSLTPYNFVSNNPVMRVDPTGMIDVDVLGLVDYIDQANAVNLDEATVVRDKPSWLSHKLWQVKQFFSSIGESKQANGADMYADNDEQGIKWPDADHKEDPQELFTMKGPSKASGGIGQKISQALGNIAKWVSWGSKDEVPSQNPASPGSSVPTYEDLDTFKVYDTHRHNPDGTVDTIKDTDTTFFTIKKRK